jgi:hypothetical protein
MVVAMSVMRMMQMPIHQIIDMVTMGNCLMAAIGAMFVA